MIDRYAAWYTPTVLMIVGIVLFFAMKMKVDDAWERAIAMLVVACPCALILATPTAMVAALSSASRLGVLVKSVVDLEAARNLTAMIFNAISRGSSPWSTAGSMHRSPIGIL